MPVRHERRRELRDVLRRAGEEAHAARAEVEAVDRYGVRTAGKRSDARKLIHAKRRHRSVR
jgi:hypothetical protein